MKKLSFLAIASAMACLLAPAANADTFLQYSTTSSASTISFDGTTLIGTAIPVDLSYLDPITGELATGTLNFSATAVAGSAGDLGGFFYGVGVTNLSFSILNGGTDILSGTAATGTLDGTDAGLSLDPNSPVTFESTLYGSITGLSFQINTGSPSPDLSDSGGMLSGFTASAGTGAFTGTLAAPTPEPASLLLLGSGMASLAGVFRRKRVA